MIHQVAPFPSTKRLIMRRFTEDDVGLLVDLDSDPEVMHYLTGGDPTARTEIEQELLPRLLDQYAWSEFGRWAALERDSGEFIGWFALDPTKESADLELGYRLRRAAWGKGYATEGSLALVEFAFDRGAERIYAETMAVNTRSRRVMERIGMRHVRTFHLVFDDPIPGTELGEVEYEITRSAARPWPPGQPRGAATT